MWNGKILSCNQKLQEIYVGLGCSVAAANRCTFEGKILLKKDRVSDVVKHVQITRKFEAFSEVH